MYTVIENVHAGDIIVDGRERTTVNRVEINACSSKGTHINSKVCYERGSIVQVKEGMEQGTDEIEEEEFDPGILV